MFIFSIICSLFINKNKEYETDSKFYRFLLYTCTKIIKFFARIKIKVTGAELIPKEGRYLVVGNHRSAFDPILLWEVIDKSADLCFISKPENFKFFAFGKIIKRCCFMAIDRDNPRNALATINKAARFLKEDKFSIVVYPEGTRNKTEEPLLPFHNGLFKIAKKAHVPVLVVTSRNNEKIVKNFPFHGTEVYYDFAGVIDADQVEAMSNSEIAEKVQEMMMEKLNAAFN
ncbi:MAG: 1-acyl-sn-glycerol-3-phosphate acyltransferase [Lachnospiraceae bacterium]|nr:1-acyl-sn-glycerol-3-phosphate acyltransferase [Lachnospiraceae bacterium]